MSTIDKRIVELEFNNNNFEQGANKSMSTIDRLMEKLKFKNGSAGISDVVSSSNRLNFNAASEGVNAFSMKLSALNIAGVAAITNLTNTAVNAGKRITQAFTIAPIKDGFSEYELKMNSIQTILTNTAQHGTKLKDVNKALNELNTYSDKTIYNFAQMTDNIGKATAAGITLEDSVTFVKGMSNAAAGFGVDATKMAGATYQMTQALSAGVVKLQDWRSLEMSGMGGKMMQDEMLSVAKSMGIVVDESVPFRESLKDGWLTSEVFIQAMDNMAKNKSLEQAATNVTSFTKLLDTMKETIGSGWATTFEHIFGDKDQSTKLWTNISNSFGDLVSKSTDARNKMFKIWNDKGGRDDVIEGITTMVQSIGKVISAAGEGFREIIPPMTGKRLLEMSKQFKDMTENFKNNEQVVKNVKSVFRALGSIVQLVGNTFKLFGVVLKPVTNLIDDIFLGISNLIGGFADLISNTVEYLNKVKLFDGIGKFMTQLYENFATIGRFISDIFTNIVEGVGTLNIGDTFAPVIGVFGKVLDGFTEILSGIGTLIGTLDMNGLMKMIQTLLVGKGLVNLKGLIKEIGGTTESFGNFGSNIGKIIGSVTDTFEAMQTRLNSGTLMKIAGAIGVLSLALVVLSSIDEAGMDNAIVGMMTIATTLTLSFMSLLKVVNGKNIASLLFLGGALKGIATAMLLLSGAMKVMSTIEWEGIAKGLTSIIVMTTALTASMKILSGNKTSMGLPMAIIGVATSILILTQAVKQLADINPASLTDSLVSVGVLMAELTAFMAVMKNVKMKPSAVVGIIAVSGALNLITLAVSQLSSLNVDQMLQGLGAVGIILAELALFTRLVGNGKGMMQTSVGITILSGAMLILVESIKRLGSLKPETLTKGLIGLAGALVSVGLGTKLIPKGLITKAIGLNILAVAMMNISTVMKDMGGEDWESIGKALVSIGGALVVVAGGLSLMGGTLLGSAALTIAAGALSLLTIQFKALASLNIEQIGIGLLGMAGIFGVLGLAGLLIAPLSPMLLALAGSMLALSASAIVTGAGLTLIGTGLGLITGAILLFVEGMRQFTGVFPKFIDSIFTSLTELGPKFAEAITTISSNAGEITMAILNIFKDLILHIPEVVKIGVDMVIGFVEGITSQGDRLITAGVTMIVTLLEGLLLHIGDISQAALDIIVAFVNFIASNLGAVIQAGVDLALALINGLADAIDNNHEKVKDAIMNLLSAMANAGMGLLEDIAGDFLNGGGDIIQGLIDGIKAKAADAKKSVDQTIDNAISGAKDLGGKLVYAGKQLINGFKNGIKAKAQSAIDSVTSVVTGAINKAKKLLGIHSPSRVFASIGKFTVEGFTNSVKKNGYKAISSVGNMATNVIDTFSAAVKGIGDTIGPDINPVITPIVDLTDVKNGGKTIDGLLGGLTSIGGGISASLTSSIKMSRDSSNYEVLSAIDALKDTLSRPNNVNNYNLAGITYDDGSAISNTIGDLVRMARVERRR